MSNIFFSDFRFAYHQWYSLWKVVGSIPTASISLFYFLGEQEVVQSLPLLFSPKFWRPCVPGLIVQTVREMIKVEWPPPSQQFSIEEHFSSCILWASSTLSYHAFDFDMNSWKWLNDWTIEECSKQIPDSEWMIFPEVKCRNLSKQNASSLSPQLLSRLQSFTHFQRWSSSTWSLERRRDSHWA
jgi:hypothetical protein